jgi:hypothetical protein
MASDYHRLQNEAADLNQSFCKRGLLHAGCRFRILRPVHLTRRHRRNSPPKGEPKPCRPGWRLRASKVPRTRDLGAAVSARSMPPGPGTDLEQIRHRFGPDPNRFGPDPDWKALHAGLANLNSGEKIKEFERILACNAVPGPKLQRFDPFPKNSRPNPGRGMTLNHIVVCTAISLLGSAAEANTALAAENRERYGIGSWVSFPKIPFGLGVASSGRIIA